MTVGLFWQPGGIRTPELMQALADKPPGLMTYLSDQIQQLVEDLAEGSISPVTVIIYRSTHKKWYPSHTAVEWVLSESDFIRAKTGLDGLAALYALAREAGVELAWQVINEESPDVFEEAQHIGAFEMARAAAAAEMGGRIAAIGFSNAIFDRPNLLDGLEASGILDLCRRGFVWLTMNMYFYPEFAGTAADWVKGEFVKAEDITAQAIIDGTVPAYLGFSYLKHPRLRDCNVLVPEIGPCDRNHDPDAPEAGLLRGIQDGWTNSRSGLSIEDWLFAELNHYARVASECPGDVRLSFFSYGPGASGRWTDFDIQQYQTAYIWHLNGRRPTIEEQPIEKPPTDEPPPDEPDPKPDPIDWRSMFPDWMWERWKRISEEYKKRGYPLR